MTSDDGKLPDEPDGAAAATREPFLLSPEQQDTGALLERLLGTAMAERYVDFLKLTAEATGLNVTIPLAGHALREMESTIRLTLGASMDSDPEQEGDAAQAETVAEALRPHAHSQDDIDRAVKSLQPRVSHAAQIRKIAEHLGLAPDGDIANAWVTLSRTADQAHK